MRPFAGQTAAGTFTFNGGTGPIVSYGLAGAEKISLEIYGGDGSYVPLRDNEGNLIELTVAKPMVTLGYFNSVPLRATKTATAAVAGITVY